MVDKTLPNLNTDQSGVAIVATDLIIMRQTNAPDPTKDSGVSVSRVVFP